MADSDEDKEQSTTANDNTASQAGDPGRTPGSAEGDEATVDEALAQHEAKDETEASKD